MQGRLQQFDIMKGIAIYLVVVGHLLNKISWGGSSIIFFLHMPVFFFVSGYFAERSLGKYTTGVFCKNKILSLVVPYIIWSGISLAANTAFVILKGEFAPEWFMKESVDVFLYARSVWFLIVLFFAQVFYALIRNIKVGKASVICYLILWVVVSIVLPDSILAFYKIKWLFPFLLCGAAAANRKKSLPVKMRQLLMGSVLFLLAAVFLYEEEAADVYAKFLYADISGVIAGILYYAISFLGIWCLYGWSVYIAEGGKGKEILSMMGRYSIDIYVTHMLLIKFLFIMPGVMQRNKVLAVFYVLFYACIIVGCIVTACDKCLKHIKIYNLTVGRKNR